MVEAAVVTTGQAGVVGGDGGMEGALSHLPNIMPKTRAKTEIACKQGHSVANYATFMPAKAMLRG